MFRQLFDYLKKKCLLSNLHSLFIEGHYLGSEREAFGLFSEGIFTAGRK